MSATRSLIGAIVYCWMPFAEAPTDPGPKYRPVLVIGHDLEKGRLCVAPGTSRKLDRQFKGEFIVQNAAHDSGGLGLHGQTKFCLRSALWLPLSPEFFQGHGRKYRFAGAVPLRQQFEFFEALREAEPYLDREAFSSRAWAS